VNCTLPHVERSGPRWVFPTGADPDGFGVRLVADGSTQVVWTCTGCGHRSTPITHYMAQGWGIDIAALPVVADYAGVYGRCSVHDCTENGAQLHHFAPTGIFGAEADYWPVGYLCRRHHAEWHQRVTPGLVNGL
jgi:hypothetical protein